MTGLDRLNAKLAKFKGADHAEQVVTDAIDGILAAILAEIEETILPREMVVTDENGARFVLVAAGRRLLQVSDPAAPRVDRLPAGDEDPAERIVAAFNGPFRAFLERARELSIDAARPQHRIDPTEIGCSVETLAQAVAGGAQPLPEADPVAEALDLGAAGLRIAGDAITGRHGPPDDLARLETFADAAGALSRVTPGEADSPVCTVFGAPDASGRVLARVAFRGEMALVLAPAEAALDLIALCHQPFPTLPQG